MPAGSVMLLARSVLQLGSVPAALSPLAIRGRKVAAGRRATAVLKAVIHSACYIPVAPDQHGLAICYSPGSLGSGWSSPGLCTLPYGSGCSCPPPNTRQHTVPTDCNLREAPPMPTGKVVDRAAGTPRLNFVARLTAADNKPID